MTIGALMVVRLRQEITDEELQWLRTELLRADLEYYYKHNDTYAYLNEFLPRDGNPLSRIPAGIADGMDVTIPSGKMSNGRDWLHVHLVDDLYEPHYYARGVAPLHIALAEWLEQHLPGCQVWYGNDCSDEFYPYGPAERALLRKFFDRFRHSTYDYKLCTPETEAAAEEYWNQVQKSRGEPPWLD